VDKDHDDFTLRRSYDCFWHMSGVVTTGRGCEHFGGANSRGQEPLERDAGDAPGAD